ncbi:MAG: lamin tail domain-containing protein, partial [Bradymonadaceae bacterium]
MHWSADDATSEAVLALVVAAVLALASGCGNEISSQSKCSSDSDCSSDEFCGPAGQCTRECSKSTAAEDCEVGERCTDRGECIPESACSGDQDCSSPPEATCDGKTLITYSQPGRCEETENGLPTCRYSKSTETCEYGCREGACREGPCADITCDDPPPNECTADGQKLVVHESKGTCEVSNGRTSCSYPSSTKDCQHGCAAGACRGGACAGVTCKSPPDPKCKEDRAISYKSPGNCKPSGSGAACEYPREVRHCQYSGGTCASGKCTGTITQRGPLVVTEVMADPKGAEETDREWFEVYNTGNTAVALNGWRLKSRRDGKHSISKSAATVPAGGYALLAESDDPAGNSNVSPDYVYDEITLRNGTDTIRLIDPSDRVSDFVLWEAGSMMDGHSRKYSTKANKDPTANDDFTNWCPSLEPTERFSRWKDRGTPGSQNEVCADRPCRIHTCERPVPFCRGNRAVRPTKSKASCKVSGFNNPYCDFGVKTFTCTGSKICGAGKCRQKPPNLPGPGELIITETMGNPSAVSDGSGEWIELHNPTQSAKSVFSLVISDGQSGSS